MTIYELKKMLNEKDFKVGAKKAMATISLATILATAPTNVKASVPAENIIGDLQYDEDRTEVKQNDYQEIRSYFTGYNSNGEFNASLQNITKAIELSNAYNNYFFDLVDYTNTTKDEVLNLDIEKLYDEYYESIIDGTEESYCRSNLNIKPAVDAYITFACGTVSNSIKLNIASKIGNIIKDYGYDVRINKITISENEAKVIATIDERLQVIELNGEALEEIQAMCTTLTNTYSTATQNIGGYSNEYDNSFAYNGIDKETKASVWLSFPDDTKKANLTEGIEIAEKILAEEGLSFYWDNAIATNLTEEDIELLTDLDYSDYEISTALKTTASIGKVAVQKLIK